MTISKNRGFTLIELLVVITIIAILAAIALPSFRTVMENSKTSKCANNLKQVGAAMVLYSNDHNGLYPISGAVLPWNTTDSTTGQQSWIQQLDPYVGNAGDPALMRPPGVFTCPSSSGTNPVLKYYSYFNGVHAALAYANPPGGNGSVQFAAIKRSLLEHPAEHIMSGDITDMGSFTQMDADKDDYHQNPIDTQSTYHNGTINVLFYDGHVENLHWNGSNSAGYFDASRMATHYNGTGPGDGTFYTYLNP